MADVDGSSCLRDAMPGPNKSSSRFGETDAWSQRRTIWPLSTIYAPPSSMRENEARIDGGKRSMPFVSAKPSSGVMLWIGIRRGYRYSESSVQPKERSMRISWIRRSVGSRPAVQKEIRQ